MHSRELADYERFLQLVPNNLNCDKRLSAILRKEPWERSGSLVSLLFVRACYMWSRSPTYSHRVPPEMAGYLLYTISFCFIISATGQCICAIHAL